MSPSRYGWIGTGAGRSGISYNYVVWENESAVELYIDRGKDSDEENKAIFDALFAKKSEIESKAGIEFDWQRLDNKRACRIRRSFNFGGYKDESKWGEIIDATVDGMIKLEFALKPYVQKIG